MHRMLVVTLLLATGAQAATTVQGTLSGNTIWTLAGSPYNVSGDVTVPLGATLTIQAGVTVNFSATDGLLSGSDATRTELIVRGALRVLGTASQPVQMSTSGAKGAWYGINHYVSSALTEIQHAVIEKAYRGIDTDGLVLAQNVVIQNTLDSCVILFGGTTTLQNSRLSNCGTDAVYAIGSSNLSMSYSLVTGTGDASSALNLSGTATLDHNTIADNGWGGILIDGTEPVSLTNNIIAKNGTYGIRRTGLASVIFQANDVWSHTNNLTGMPSGTGNLAVDPKFVGPGNYNLQGTSPCRASGLNGSDMGAFPYTAPISRVEISPSSTSVAGKGVVTFTAKAFDANNTEVPTSFSWTANSAAGSVTNAGAFTAGCTLGTTPSAVTVSAGGQSASAQVTVTTGALTALNVQPSAPTLPPGATQTFTAQGQDSCANPVNQSVSWQALPAVGAITPAGVFTATTTPGTYTNAVTATSGGVSKSVTVTIATGAVSQVTVSPASVSLTPQGSQTFTVVAKDAAGNTVTAPAAWYVVSGGGTITPQGVFTAGTTAGTYTNTVEAVVGGVKGRATITLMPGSPARLQISPQTATLAPLGATQFSAQVFDAHNNLSPAMVSWAVLTSAAGRIDASGAFTAGNIPGNYPSSVRASAGNASATANVVIEVGALSKLVLTPSHATLRAGGTLAFAVIGQDAAGNTVPIAPTWKVLAGGGTIDERGVFSAGTKPGEFVDTVLVEMNGIAAKATVTVTPGPVAVVQLTPSYPELMEGRTQMFAARALDAFENEVSPVQWVFTVDPRAGSIASNGLFTAAANPGDYTDAVRASTEGVSGRASVRILPASNVVVENENPDALTDDGDEYRNVDSGCGGCSGGGGLGGVWALGWVTMLFFRRGFGQR